MDGRILDVLMARYKGVFLIIAGSVCGFPFPIVFVPIFTGVFCFFFCFFFRFFFCFAVLV
jgi:hypothetical protein